MRKAGIQNDSIETNTVTFQEAMAQDVIANFPEIQNAAQSIKDVYFDLMTSNTEEMTKSYQNIKSESQTALDDLKANYPAELNRQYHSKLVSLIDYSSERIVHDVRLEYHIECQNCKFSLSDILNYIDLASNKEGEIEVIKNSFVKEAPKTLEPNEPEQPRKIQLNVQEGVMTVGTYRQLLVNQIQAMAGMSEDKEIDLSLNK